MKGLRALDESEHSVQGNLPSPFVRMLNLRIHCAIIFNELKQNFPSFSYSLKHQPVREANVSLR